MMDISDGLLLDASRLCAASGCGAEIRLDALPLSRAFIAERGADRRARITAATGGDDYALLAALPADFDPLGLSLPPGTILARIGELAGGKGSSSSMPRAKCRCRSSLGMNIALSTRQWVIALMGLASGMVTALLLN